MKIDCNAYHLAFLLFILQGGFDVQEKAFGLIKVKLDSLDASFVDQFATYDVVYLLCFGISNLLFWRMPWTLGFRKVAIISLTIRAVLYFCCMMAPADTPFAFCSVLWAFQGLLQGLIQAPLTGLILQQYRNLDERWSEWRWVLFTFFVGIISSIMAFVSAPNVADETLCSTLITIGLLVVNVLNYVVCFFPYEQVEMGMGSLRNEKEAPTTGTVIQRLFGSLGDRFRECKQFIFDRQLITLCFSLTMVQAIRYYMFFRLPLELYYRVLFPAPPFQLMFLSGASMFEFIGLIGCVILLALRNRVAYLRNLSADRPFAMAYLALFISAPLFTSAIQDVDRIEDSYTNMEHLWLYVIAIALSYYARVVLMGPMLLRVAESTGNTAGALAFVHGFSSILMAFSIVITELMGIEGTIERSVPYAVIGGLAGLIFFLTDACCKRPTVLVSNIGGTSYRPLLTAADTENP